MKESIFNISCSKWGAYEFFEFITSYIIPIVASLAIIIGGLWAVYKYFNEKNREFYLNILENVYAPLFNELVKNEFGRKILKSSEKSKLGNKSYSIKDEPFIVWKNVTTNLKIENGILSREKKEIIFFDMDAQLQEIYTDSSKLKYAPRDLVALIENYFFLEGVKGAPLYESEKLKIQHAIRKNIIIGYKKYRRKLGLKDVCIIKYCYSLQGKI